MSLAAKRTMTIAELADYLGSTPIEMRRLFDSRKKVGFQRFKVGNKWCANLEDVQDWLLSMADELGK
jgi:CRP-like cAMP-binding protein